MKYLTLYAYVWYTDDSQQRSFSIFFFNIFGVKPKILISNGSITHIHHCLVIENAIRYPMFAAWNKNKGDNISNFTLYKPVKDIMSNGIRILIFLLFLEIEIKRIAYLIFQLAIPILTQNLDILCAKIILLSQEAREIYLSINVNLSNSYQCHIFFHSPPFGDYCALITYVFLPDWREGCLRNTAKLHS